MAAALNRGTPRRRSIYTGLYILLICLTIASIWPLFWTVSTSLKADHEMFTMPPTVIPQTWKFENYLEAWRAGNFSRYFLNSTVVSVGGTLLTLFFCAVAAYPFAKLEFAGKNVLFWFVVSSMMVPGAVTLVPTFVILKHIPLFGGNDLMGTGGIGWLNSYYGLIAPALGNAFGAFLLRQFMLTIPDDLLDAARIDGCSEYRILGQIILPLCKPALATLSVFTFQNYWNDFIWPLVVTFSDEMRTIQLGLTIFQQRFTTDWGPLMSGVMMSIVPTLILYLAAQKYFVEGIAASGLKG